MERKKLDVAIIAIDAILSILKATKKIRILFRKDRVSNVKPNNTEM